LTDLAISFFVLIGRHFVAASDAFAQKAVRGNPRGRQNASHQSARAGNALRRILTNRSTPRVVRAKVKRGLTGSQTANGKPVEDKTVTVT
jgi:hypothetical protein